MPEERKLVTVLFADIVGSTAMGTRADPELVRATLRAAFSDIREVVGAYGGTVEKFIGDAVFAVFGVPVAHEDDAERAVRAALAMRERVAPFRLELRIGVSSGEAITSGTEGREMLVVGQPGSMAARLQQASSPGEILAGDLTRELTARVIRYGAEREIEAKGFGRVRAAPAEGAQAPVPEQRRGLRGRRAPLIGRARELSALREAMAAAWREQRPRLVTIIGQAGAGKSRLASEFIATLDPGMVLYGRCLPYGEGVAFYAIQQMLRAEAGVDQADARDEAQRKLTAHVTATFGAEEDAEAVVARLNVLAGIAEASSSLPDVASDDIAEELGWGLRRYIERRSQAHQLIVVFEDIHWAPATVLDLIADVADRSRGPIMVLCLTRPELLDARLAWGAGRENAVTVALGPLSVDETGSLVAALLGLNEIADDLRADVVARAAGNPLYVEELLNALIETGRIRIDRRTVATTGSPVELPKAIRGIIAARLDAVPPEVKGILQAASVIGPVFTGQAVAALRGSSASRQLREAERRDLVEQLDEGRRALGGVYRFKHVLVRDVAYGSLSKAERISTHDQYGRWIEATAGEGREDVAELAAHHADEAFRLAVELRHLETASLGQRAADRLSAAARRALDRGDLGAARSLWKRVVSIGGLVELPASIRLEAEGRSALLIEDEAQMRSAVLAALEKARVAGPNGLLIDLLAVASAVASESSIPRAQDLSAEALRLARSVGDPELVAGAQYIEIANLRFEGPELAEARRRCEEALAEARRHGAKQGALRLLSQLAYLEHLGARFGHADQLTIEGEQAAVTAGALLSRFRLLTWRARNAAFAGQATLAWAAADSVRPIADRIGSRGARTGMNIALGLAHFEAHDLRASRGALEEALSLTGPTDAAVFSWIGALLVRTLVALGDPVAARKVFDRISGIRVAWVFWRTVLPLTGAFVSAGELHHDRADALFRDAREAEGHPLFRAYAGLEYGRYLLARNRPTEAFSVLSDARLRFADPFAEPRQKEIDALLEKCAVPRPS